MPAAPTQPWTPPAARLPERETLPALPEPRRTPRAGKRERLKYFGGFTADELSAKAESTLRKLMERERRIDPEIQMRGRTFYPWRPGPRERDPRQLPGIYQQREKILGPLEEQRYRETERRLVGRHFERIISGEKPMSQQDFLVLLAKQNPEQYMPALQEDIMYREQLRKTAEAAAAPPDNWIMRGLGMTAVEIAKGLSGWEHMDWIGERIKQAGAGVEQIALPVGAALFDAAGRIGMLPGGQMEQRNWQNLWEDALEDAKAGGEGRVKLSDFTSTLLFGRPNAWPEGQKKTLDWMGGDPFMAMWLSRDIPNLVYGAGKLGFKGAGFLGRATLEVARPATSAIRRTVGPYVDETALMMKNMMEGRPLHYHADRVWVPEVGIGAERGLIKPRKGYWYDPYQEVKDFKWLSSEEKSATIASAMDEALVVDRARYVEESWQMYKANEGVVRYRYKDSYLKGKPSFHLGELTEEDVAMNYWKNTEMKKWRVQDEIVEDVLSRPIHREYIDPATGETRLVIDPLAIEQRVNDLANATVSWKETYATEFYRNARLKEMVRALAEAQTAGRSVFRELRETMAVADPKAFQSYMDELSKSEAAKSLLGDLKGLSPPRNAFDPYSFMDVLEVTGESGAGVTARGLDWKNIPEWLKPWMASKKRVKAGERLMNADAFGEELRGAGIAARLGVPEGTGAEITTEYFRQLYDLPSQAKSFGQRELGEKIMSDWVGKIATESNLKRIDDLRIADDLKANEEIITDFINWRSANVRKGVDDPNDLGLFMSMLEENRRLKHLSGIPVSPSVSLREMERFKTRYPFLKTEDYFTIGQQPIVLPPEELRTFKEMGFKRPLRETASPREARPHPEDIGGRPKHLKRRYETEIRPFLPPPEGAPPTPKRPPPPPRPMGMERAVPAFQVSKVTTIPVGAKTTQVTFNIRSPAGEMVNPEQLHTLFSENIKGLKVKGVGDPVRVTTPSPAARGLVGGAIGEQRIFLTFKNKKLANDFAAKLKAGESPLPVRPGTMFERIARPPAKLPKPKAKPKRKKK